MTAAVVRAAGAVLHGHILAHGDPNDTTVPLLAALANQPGTGLVITGADTAAVHRARAALTGPVVVDSGYWRANTATPAQPMSPVIASGGLFPATLDSLAHAWSAVGADVTLQPTGLIETDRWDVFARVRAAAHMSSRPDVLPFFPMDAAMLDSGRAAQVAVELQAVSGPAAVMFADSDQPLVREGRVAALRWLLAEVPGLIVLATEPLVALDAAARGSATSIGIRSGYRHPQRPQDRAKGSPISAGWLPGLFLRELLELRSPNAYADWYITSPSPRCQTCGRALDVFSTSTADKQRILLHNVHTWLDLANDMRQRGTPTQQQIFLARERLVALDRHLQLHPHAPKHSVDMLLRRLVTLDDPQQRKVRPSGAFI